MEAEAMERILLAVSFMTVALNLPASAGPIPVPEPGAGEVQSVGDSRVFVPADPGRYPENVSRKEPYALRLLPQLLSIARIEVRRTADGAALITWEGADGSSIDLFDDRDSEGNGLLPFGTDLMPLRSSNGALHFERRAKTNTGWTLDITVRIAHEDGVDWPYPELVLKLFHRNDSPRLGQVFAERFFIPEESGEDG